MCNGKGEFYMNQHELGFHIHPANRIVFNFGDADPAWQSLIQIVFGNDGEYEPEGLRQGLRQRIRDNPQWRWYFMEIRDWGYCGFLAVCEECGAVMKCGWTPTSTRGWRDHQRARLLTWCGCPVPELYKRPLEQHLPTV